MIHYKEFAAQLRSVSEDQRLAKIKSYLSTLPDGPERREAARYLVSFPDGNDDASTTVFVLLHGIRTAGEWQDRISQRLTYEHQVIALPCKYPVHNVWAFLIPPLRCKAVRIVERHLDDVSKLYPDAKVVVVAHSFGTWIVSKLLQQRRIRIDRLLMCGSVVPQEFNWGAALPNGARTSIVNDVGTKDVWPIMAHITAIGCGPSGFLGFGSPRVVDRFHSIGHNDFFHAQHVREYLVPFLIEGRVTLSVHTEERPPTGYLKNLLCSLPNGVGIWAAIAAGLIWMFAR